MTAAIWGAIGIGFILGVFVMFVFVMWLGSKCDERNNRCS
jgi:hypothetical protein